MLSFWEAYTKAACSKQPPLPDSNATRVYREECLNEAQNNLLNSILGCADGRIKHAVGLLSLKSRYCVCGGATLCHICRYAHFGTDQRNMTKPQEDLVNVLDTDYTFIDDSKTAAMMIVVRGRLHSDLCGQYRFASCTNLSLSLSAILVVL